VFHSPTHVPPRLVNNLVGVHIWDLISEGLDSLLRTLSGDEIDSTSESIVDIPTDSTSTESSATNCLPGFRPSPVVLPADEPFLEEALSVGIDPTSNL
jgi:hypothetical protein